MVPSGGCDFDGPFRPFLTFDIGQILRMRNTFDLLWRRMGQDCPSGKMIDHRQQGLRRCRSGR